MPRPAGSKNKAKTVAQLVELIQSAAEREGVDVSEILVNKAAKEIKKEDAPETDNEALKAAQEKIANFKNLEIDIPQDEIDHYKCGNCQAELSGEVPECPECGAKLQW